MYALMLRYDTSALMSEWAVMFTSWGIGWVTRKVLYFCFCLGSRQLLKDYIAFWQPNHCEGDAADGGTSVYSRRGPGATANRGGWTTRKAIYLWSARRPVGRAAAAVRGASKWTRDSSLAICSQTGQQQRSYCRPAVWGVTHSGFVSANTSVRTPWHPFIFIVKQRSVRSEYPNII